MSINNYKIYQIDAFANQAFEGNPAAVVPLEEWLPKETMQKIAMENNLAETAFIVPSGDGYGIRWFCPGYEIDLCGHATLAAAWVIFNELHDEREELIFHSFLSGKLRAFRAGEHIGIDLPARPPVKVPVPENAEAALGFKPLAAYKSRDLILLMENEDQIKNLSPVPSLMKEWDALLTVPTSISSEYDFVSRVFDPHDMLIEDPVTGSAHCSLVPYWNEVLGKHHLQARQLSERGGTLICELTGDRVLLKGKAVKYMEGNILF